MYTQYKYCNMHCNREGSYAPLFLSCTFATFGYFTILEHKLAKTREAIIQWTRNGHRHIWCHLEQSPGAVWMLTQLFAMPPARLPAHTVSSDAQSRQRGEPRRVSAYIRCAGRWQCRRHDNAGNQCLQDSRGRHRHHSPDGRQRLDCVWSHR